MSSDLSERYEVWEPFAAITMWRIRDRNMGIISAAFNGETFPDAEARARQLCAELNAAEAKKASEKP